jgi:hypothetical protein
VKSDKLQYFCLIIEIGEEEASGGNGKAFQENPSVIIELQKTFFPPPFLLSAKTHCERVMEMEIGRS